MVRKNIVTYADGTKITDPFFLKKCTSCGYEVLSTRKSNICSKCNSEAVCIPANEVKKESLFS